MKDGVSIMCFSGRPFSTTQVGTVSNWQDDDIMATISVAVVSCTCMYGVIR